MALATDYGPNDARSLSGAINAANTLINQLTDGTGWRNVLTLVEAGASSTAVQMIRRGNEVTVRALAASPNSALRWISNLPAGWRPAANTSKKVLGADIIIGSGGFINFVANTPTSSQTWIEFTYEVPGAFPLPANYPGSGA